MLHNIGNTELPFAPIPGRVSASRGRDLAAIQTRERRANNDIVFAVTTAERRAAIKRLRRTDTSKRQN